MKLAAIYNVWDDEHFEASVKNIRPCVDVIIAVTQHISNRGERYTPTVPNEVDRIVLFNPDLNLNANKNEEKKRNEGLEVARSLGCTHFIHFDCDEFYFREDFENAKVFVEENDLDASWCRLKTYYKYPTKQLVPEENYFVPFIHKLYEKTRMEFNLNYPAFVDPTRRTNTFDKGMEIKFLKMHHYSFVRKNILRKFRNSSSWQAFGGFNEKIWSDFDLTGEMFFFKNFDTVDVPDYFGLCA